MNVVAWARFIGNLAIAAGVMGILFVMMPLFPEVSGRVWTTVLFAIVGLGIVAQLVAAIARPGEAKAAWDEQSEASNRASYVFGYWCVMALFLAFLAAVFMGRMSAETAFFFMSLPLAIGPSVYMVWAFLRGRAG